MILIIPGLHSPEETNLILAQIPWYVPLRDGQLVPLAVPSSAAAIEIQINNTCENKSKVVIIIIIFKSHSTRHKSGNEPAAEKIARDYGQPSVVVVDAMPFPCPSKCPTVLRWLKHPPTLIPLESMEPRKV